MSTDPSETINVQPLRRPPLKGRAGTFLRVAEQQHDAASMLRLAGATRRALPPDCGETVGLWASSPAFVAAGSLALWSEGRHPLLLDPGLRQEPRALLEQFPGLAVLVEPGARCHLDAAVQVPDAGEEERLQPRWPAPRALAARFFTSGSSGEPKLVDKRAYQLYAQLARLHAHAGDRPSEEATTRRQGDARLLALPAAPSVFCLVPPFHILGYVYGLFLPLLDGGRTAFAGEELPAAWEAQIRALRPDLVVGVPLHYRLLARHLARAGAGSLPPACYFSSGGPLSPAVHQAFAASAGQQILQMYGSTETGGLAARRGFGPWTPLPGLSWQMRPEDGRLMVRSAWQESPGEWTVTDDVVEPDAGSGGFRLVGRADSVVKVAGKRFSTNEVQAAAQALAGVEQAEVVTYPRYGETAVALFVVPAPGSELSPKTVRRALAEGLAGFKQPRTIAVLRQMPRLSSGKVDRQALVGRALILAGRG